MLRVACVLSLLAVGCSSSKTEPPPAAAAKAAAPTYTVRAKVTAVDGSTWKLHHEEIPTFADRGGVVVGMEPMVMNFAAPAGKSAKTGDLLEVTFEMHWVEKPNLRITAVKPLPAGTTLKL